MWKEIKQFFREVFKDERGHYSSKRLIGIIAGLTLCVTLVLNSFYNKDIKPSDTLVYAVAMLSFGCLGLASIDKIWGRVQMPYTPKESDLIPDTDYGTSAVPDSDEPLITPE
jgi:hypothetical protein